MANHQSTVSEDNEAIAYLAPTTIADALQLLAELGDHAKIVAGGQSLLVLLRQGLVQPDFLIGLKQIPELTAIARSGDGGLTIGAMVTQHTIEHSPLVRDRYPALADAAALVASPQVRRQGTIGGNLCHADPTSDSPAALIALGARLEIASQASSRLIPVEAIFRDYMEPALDLDELVVSIHLPPPPPRSGAAYLKHRIRGVNTALVGVGVGLVLAEDNRTCVDARIGLVGAGPTPLRAVQAEAALIGQAMTAASFAAAGIAAAAECTPLSDTEGSEWYRRQMVELFVQRAATRALTRATGGEG